jgi:DNA-binding transcriptional ArsR family regulator
MSISYMALAWKADIPSGRKLVLLCLCDHANGQGECYPSVEAIAHKCNMGQRTVQQHIGELERAGILLRRFRKGRSTLYRLEPRAFCNTAESAARQNSTLQCAASAESPQQLSHSAPADPAPISISDPSMESSPKQQVLRNTPLPLAWTLPEVWEKWALEAQPAWSPAHVHFVAEKFRDHWTAVPGQRGIKADWFAAWRNWCRNERPVGPHHHAAPGTWWQGPMTAGARDNPPLAQPLPGESFATFNARRLQQRVAGSRTVPVSVPPAATAASARSRISPANRAAALDAARALKSRLTRRDRMSHEYGAAAPTILNRSNSGA